jgi:hypothetical protein
MQRFTWSIGFVVLAAVAATSSACTVTVTSGDGGDLFTDDGGGQETSTRIDTGTTADTSPPQDSAATTDTGTTPDTGQLPDTSTTADGSDGATCPILQQVTFGSAACDACLGSSCCDSTTACFTGAENDCESKVTCFADCLAGNPDAGVAAGDVGSCKMACAGPDAMASPFDAWVTCISNNCATSCQ